MCIYKCFFVAYTYVQMRMIVIHSTLNYDRIFMNHIITMLKFFFSLSTLTYSFTHIDIHGLDINIQLNSSSVCDSEIYFYI